MNKYLFQKSDAAAICKNCLNTSVRAGISAVAFKISYVCRCGELVRIEYNSSDIPTKEGMPALKDEDKVFCPVCSSLLFDIDKKSVRGFSFRVKCKCGGVFERQRSPLKRPRRIGTYAALDDDQNNFN